jgi:protein-S-isoprenylcysteine O-methyltransferase Ste14
MPFGLLEIVGQGQMFTTICAYLLIAVFFLGIEGRLRQGQQAKSLQPGQFDRGSTGLIGMAVQGSFVILLFAPVLNHFQVGQIRYGTLVGGFGLAVMMGGIALRYWAAKTLGKFYTRTLLIKAEHQIVESGPYRIIRHPGYLGFMLMLAGAGLATANWIAAALITIVVSVIYAYRIHAEENMLQAAFNEQYKSLSENPCRAKSNECTGEFEHRQIILDFLFPTDQ